MPDTAFRLLMPVHRCSAVVFASPHSGRAYPDDLVAHSALDARQIRSSEDAFVDRLFEAAPEFGAPLLAAVAPRAYVDLNRAPDELDPSLVEGVPPNRLNPRIASGLGVIPRVVAGGRQIRRGKISRAEAELRLQRWWFPYHRRLQALLDEARNGWGMALLIDCHSMPREALEGITARGARRPEVVLGDRFGASADAEIVDRVEAAFRRAGLHVVRNAPFAGAYITRHYGRPSQGQHAVQVEIDRSLYMDEGEIRPRPDFAALRALLRDVIAEIAAIGGDGRGRRADEGEGGPLAAE